jgi:hypothetical protein
MKTPSIEIIAEGLNARGTYGKYRAACPAHGGTNPTTLSIREAEDGTVLVHCFAGCSQDAVIAALCELGLWPKSAQRKRARKYCGVRELTRGEVDYMKVYVSLYDASDDTYKSDQDAEQYQRFKARLTLGGHTS